MITVEQLYKNFGVLADAKDKAGDHEAEFLSILCAVKGGPGEKRLASQFVTRFCKYFPKLAYQAINALFELCEDEDINIRKQAIKDLPTLCKVNAEYVPKIAEAFTQLLQQCDDQVELSLVHSSLTQLFSINAKSVLHSIFNHVLGDDDGIREKAIKFLFINLRKLPAEVLNKESQDFIVNECKKVLHDVTKDEFIFIMEILKSVPCMNTVQGRQQLLEIVTEQAELDQPFEATESDVVDRLLSCAKQAIPLFSKNVHSKMFVTYICNSVLPSLGDVVVPEDGMDIKLELLKLLAEISEYNGFTQEEVKTPLSNVFTKLIEYMPLPLPEVEANKAIADEEPKLQFSYVECLMFTFHQLGRRYPEFLTADESADRLKDFKLRLQYFARGVQIYIKQLRQDLQGKTGDALKSDESKLKVCALKVTSNINGLIKDLFHHPPAYKCVITLSWKPATKIMGSGGTMTMTGQKRFTPIEYEGSKDDASNKKKPVREPRQLYAPPSGKFSEKAGSFTNPTGGSVHFGRRGRGRGFGRGRGRQF